MIVLEIELTVHMYEIHINMWDHRKFILKLISMKTC